MAKPAIQVLQKGKFLCGKNFPTFSDTFNYAVNRLENLKGDGDVDPRRGHIKIDNTNPEFPIIRYNLPAEDAKDKKYELVEPYELDIENGKIKNCYVICEELLYECGELGFDKASLEEGAVIYLKYSSYSPAATCEVAPSVDEYRTAACSTMGSHYLPLYLVMTMKATDKDNGEQQLTLLDLRRLAHAQSWIMSDEM